MSTYVASAEQHAVITHPLTPLRVTAGAGTGKTSTVAHRIGHLVRAEGIEPEQVLGITFTNKAAEELAARVREVLGNTVEPARQVDIHTYHGFAAQLLREFGPLVGVENDAIVITPVFTRQMFEMVMSSVRLPHLNQTYPGIIDDMRRLAAQMADHLATVDQVLAHTSDDPELGARRSDLATAIRIYTEEKRRLGVVDYGDLIVAANRLVADNGWLASRIRSRYRCVVLDEYQDTNPAQRCLLTELFGAGFPVTAVGDPDQTIYEWRGASLGNFRRFPVHFSMDTGAAAPTRPLTLNRRSGHRILEVANAIRSRIDNDAREPLRAVDEACDGTVRAGWFVDAVAEAEWLADDMSTVHADGVRWGDIGVLFRKNRDMAVVRDALASRDIPVEVANLGGLLSVPEIVELHAWLRLLDNPDDGPALARILTGSMHRLGLGDLASLARWVRSKRCASGIADGDATSERHATPPDIPTTVMLEAIDDLDVVEGLRPEARDSLARFATRFRTLLEVAQGSTLVELTRQILDTTGAWQEIEALGDAARLSARLNTYRFLDLAEQWSPLEGRPTLTSFLRYLATVDDEPAEELDTARLAGEDAVTLLTVHRAKGLEWPVVYIPGTRAKTFPSTVTGAYDNPFTRPESLPYELRLDRMDLPPLRSDMTTDQQKDLLRERHDAQEWRIAYVAATRARDHLTVTGAHWYGQPEPTQRAAAPSPLFELVSGAEICTRVATCDDPGERPETLRSDDRGLDAPDPFFGPAGWRQALRRAIVDHHHVDDLAGHAQVTAAYEAAAAHLQGVLFSLPDPPEPSDHSETATSVTGLVTYASCPRRFYWSEVDPLPRRRSPAAERGVAVHRRIELHHRGVMPLDDLTPDLYDTSLNEVSAGSGPGGGVGGTGSPFQTFIESRFSDEKPMLVEAPFELRLGDTATVRGRVDAIYRHESEHETHPVHWEIVDFKSGRPSNDPSSMVQLQCYALALDGGGLVAERPERLTVTFAYLGGRLVEQSEAVDRPWLEKAADRLDALATGIRSQSFEPRPGVGCLSCDFVKFCADGSDYVSAQTGDLRR